MPWDGTPRGPIERWADKEAAQMVQSMEQDRPLMVGKHYGGTCGVNVSKGAKRLVGKIVQLPGGGQKYMTAEEIADMEKQHAEGKEIHQ